VDQESGMTVGLPKDDQPTATTRQRLPTVAGYGEADNVVLTVNKKGWWRHGRGSIAKGLAAVVTTLSVC
jgi:hypothetical protein